jgi:hypothetical protein
MPAQERKHKLVWDLPTSGDGSAASWRRGEAFEFAFYCTRLTGGGGCFTPREAC